MAEHVYPYTELDQKTRETRLVDIQPDTFDQPLRIVLHKTVIKLGHRVGDQPVFEALSYAWGSQKDTANVIVVHESDFSAVPYFISVTRNLEEAPRYLRYEDRPRTMWIDALSINQGYIAERSWHVSMMCDIYAAATSVIVWLGPEGEDSAFALEQLRQLGEQLVLDFQNVKIKTKDSLTGPPPWDPKTGTLRFGRRELEAVTSLLCRVWFGRLWIRQEVYVAHKAVILCGTIAVEWDAVARGLFCIWDWPRRNRLLSTERVQLLAKRLELVRFLVDKTRLMSYKYLRRELSGVQWRDPRDAVYAVQGMLREKDRTLGVVPDYSLPPAEVYTDVTARLIAHHRALDILSSCDMAQHTMEGLPSWVPDWYQQTEMKMDGIMEPYWYSSGPIYPLFTYLGDGVLRVSGVEVAEVESVHLPMPPPSKELSAAFVESLRSLPLKDALEPGAAYADGSNLLEAYCRLLCADRFDDEFNMFKEWCATREDSEGALREILTASETTATVNDSFLADHTGAAYKLLRWAHIRFQGRSFFRTKQGHCGVASEATAPGDKVIVFIGSSRPALLRRVSEEIEEGTPSKWRLVSDSYVPGLMAGEALHGPLPERYKPTQWKPPGDKHSWRSGLKDVTTGKVLHHGSVVRELLDLGPGGDEDGHWRKVRISRHEFLTAGVKLEDFDLL